MACKGLSVHGELAFRQGSADDECLRAVDQRREGACAATGLLGRPCDDFGKDYWWAETTSSTPEWQGQLKELREVGDCCCRC